MSDNESPYGNGFLDGYDAALADIAKLEAAASVPPPDEPVGMIEPFLTDLPTEDEMRCPHCGSEPDDWSTHREDCPTLGTCAQTEPDLPPPWHAEADWWGWDGPQSLTKAFDFTAALRQHIKDAHAVPSSKEPTE